MSSIHLYLSHLSSLFRHSCSLLTQRSGEKKFFHFLHIGETVLSPFFPSFYLPCLFRLLFYFHKNNLYANASILLQRVSLSSHTHTHTRASTGWYIQWDQKYNRLIKNWKSIQFTGKQAANHFIGSESAHLCVEWLDKSYPQRSLRSHGKNTHFDWRSLH